MKKHILAVGALGTLITAVGACSPDASPSVIGSPPPVELAQTPVSGRWDQDAPLGIAWPRDNELLMIRGDGQDPMRQVLSSVSTSTFDQTAIRIPRPSGCLSIDVRGPRVTPVGVVVDLRCYAELDGGYHELLLVRADHSITSIGKLKWFPDSYAQPHQGAWLAGHDSGICAWIDVIPGTGPPTIEWPILVADDGDEFAVNASRDTDCEGQPKAHGLAQAQDGRLAFVASGAVRSRSGFGRLSFPVQLYLREADGTVHRLASNLVEPRSVQWSVDSQHIQMIARINETQGVWEVGLDGRLRLLLEGKFVDFAESPDGSQLAVIVDEGPTVEAANYRLFIATFE